MGQKSEDLYELLIALTGEDSDGVRAELDRLIGKLGLNPKELSENDARRLVALYLEEIQIENELQIGGDHADSTAKFDA